MAWFSSRINETRSTVQGLQYQFNYQPSGRHSPPVLTYSITAAGPGDFRLTREGKFDRLGKQLGIVAEVNTHDLQFDRTYFVGTDNPAFAQQLFSLAPARDAVSQIFSTGFTELHWNGKTIKAKWTPFHNEPTSVGQTYDAAVDSLYAILNQLPLVSAPTNLTGMSSRSKRNVAVVLTVVAVIASFFVLLGPAARYQPVDAGSMFGYSVNYGLGAFLVLGFLLVRFLKGRSAAHRELAIMLPVLLGASLIGSYAAVELINGERDISPIKVQDTLITNKYTTKRKKGYNYHAIVALEGGGTRDLSPSNSVYQQITPGKSHARISTRAGYLGFEWTVRVDYLL